MLSGIHRYSRQEEVVYGRPAGDALTATARSLGTQRLMITTTRSLAGPGGLATKLAEALGPLCVGTYAGVKAHSPREGVVEGAGQARALGSDLLVAVGGGSVIDATKVMQLCLWAGIQRPEELDRVRDPGRGRTALRSRQATAHGAHGRRADDALGRGVHTVRRRHGRAARRVKEGYAHALLGSARRRARSCRDARDPTRALVLDGAQGRRPRGRAAVQSRSARRSPMPSRETGWFALGRGLRATKRAPRDSSRLAFELPVRHVARDLRCASSGRGMGASHAIGHTLGEQLPGVPHGITSCVMLPAVLRWNESVDGDRQRLVRDRLRLERRIGRRTPRRHGPLPHPRASLPGSRRSAFAPISFAPSPSTRCTIEASARDPRPIRDPADIVEILELAREVTTDPAARSLEARERRHVQKLSRGEALPRSPGMPMRAVPIPSHLFMRSAYHHPATWAGGIVGPIEPLPG